MKYIVINKAGEFWGKKGEGIWTDNKNKAIIFHMKSTAKIVAHYNDGEVIEVTE
jgi:hypothetical protein